MMNVLLLVVCMFACMHMCIAMEFETYLEQHGKSYDAEEYEFRQTIFEMNKVKILAHNQRKSSWKLDFNKFTDMTNAELKSFRGYKKMIGSVKGQPHLMSHGRDEDYPKQLDWRNATNPTVLTPIKDQGQCGSCWAFSATSSAESAGALFTNKDADVLAPQQLVDCAPNPQHCGGTGGCEGSTAELAFQYWSHIAQGPSLEKNYPYKATDGKCKTDNTKGVSWAISGWVTLGPNDYNELMDAIQERPVSISVDASVWHSYGSGIFDGCLKSSSDIDHVVQLIGYGTDNGEDYWTVRNSWGESWGENGTIRLARQDPAKTKELCMIDKQPEDGSGCDGGPKSITVCGTCGMLSDSSYPIASSIVPRVME